MPHSVKFLEGSYSTNSQVASGSIGTMPSRTLGRSKLILYLGKPGIFRNDRFWLAADHIAEPRTMHWPAVKKLVDGIQRAKEEFKMTEMQGMNVGTPPIRSPSTDWRSIPSCIPSFFENEPNRECSS